MCPHYNLKTRAENIAALKCYSWFCMTRSLQEDGCVYGDCSGTAPELNFLHAGEELLQEGQGLLEILASWLWNMPELGHFLKIGEICYIMVVVASKLD